MTIVKLKRKGQEHKSALVLSQAGSEPCVYTAGGPGPPVPRETPQARDVATGTCVSPWGSWFDPDVGNGMSPSHTSEK